MHAKYTSDSSRFKPAKVVTDTVDSATCNVRFLDFHDVTSVPLTLIRSPASAERPEGKLMHLIYGKAVITRNDISNITLGKQKFFPDADKLEKAREDLCDIIHAMDSFEHKTLKGGDVEKRPNPYKAMDAEQRTKTMMAKVESILAYLDKHYPRSPGRTRLEEWQELVT